MIEYLFGSVLKNTNGRVIINVNGVGYGVYVPLPFLGELKEKSDSIGVFVHTRVREDQLSLFGFKSMEEKNIFEILIQINGVGPKVGLAILSTISLVELYQIALDKQALPLQNVPGIGKRTAEKIVLDLSGKIDQLSSCLPKDASMLKGRSLIHSTKQTLEKTDQFIDVKSALSNLGFKDKQIELALDQLSSTHRDAEFSTIVKESLKILKGTGKTESKAKLADTLF